MPAKMKPLLQPVCNHGPCRELATYVVHEHTGLREGVFCALHAQQRVTALDQYEALSLAAAERREQIPQGSSEGRSE